MGPANLNDLNFKLKHTLQVDASLIVVAPSQHCHCGVAYSADWPHIQCCQCDLASSDSDCPASADEWVNLARNLNDSD